MSLILVRHGQTALNAARVFQPPDTPLSPLGLAQAQALAARLKAQGIGSVLCSDLPRAQLTAQTIAQACGVDWQPSPLLQERNFGELRGLAYDSLGFNAIDMEDAPPGGESLPQLRARAQAAWAQILHGQATQPGPWVVVSHGAFLRTLLLTVLPPTPGVHAGMRLDNTSVSLLETTPSLRLTLLNCTAHLSSALRDDGHGLSGA